MTRGSDATTSGVVDEVNKTQTFTQEELRHSVIFDCDKRLSGVSGDGLLDEILSLLDHGEHRQRARKGADEARRRLTASVLLANLASTAINRVDSSWFVAIPFSNNAYAGTGLSVGTMTSLRDLMLERGLVEGRSGFRREDTFNHGYVASSRTRLRGTAAFRAMLERYGIAYRSVARRIDNGLLVLRDRRKGVDAKPPFDLSGGAEALVHMNALIGRVKINLPSEAWDRVRARYLRWSDKEKFERVSAGDESATTLFRSFKYDWGHGGRIYGGWWINLPKEERAHLTIDGWPIVELDYGRLHPSILFARAGLALDFDPYTLPGLEHPALRELGKVMFAKLLNSQPKDGQAPIIRVPAAYRALLPRSVSPSEYINRLRAQLLPIERWLLTGEGLRLQREDGDLAVEILRRMAVRGAVALPIHDSFIVEERHRDFLREIMLLVYKDKYQFEPLIR